MRAVPEQIRPWVPNTYVTLGTDGFGFSIPGPRPGYFNTDAESVVVAVLEALARDGRSTRRCLLRRPGSTRSMTFWRLRSRLRIPESRSRRHQARSRVAESTMPPRTRRLRSEAIGRNRVDDAAEDEAVEERSNRASRVDDAAEGRGG